MLTHCSHLEQGGGAGPADPATAGPMFDWDSIADPSLAGEKPARVCTDPCMPARTSRSGCKRELRRPENEQISKFERGGHTFSADQILANQNSDRLCLLCSFTRFPGGLKPPIFYLHACSRHEVKQNPVTMAGLKQKLVVGSMPSDSPPASAYAKLLLTYALGYKCKYR